jgi:leader peptidase (prepilin peptidase)/N-methyltransferase
VGLLVPALVLVGLAVGPLLAVAGARLAARNPTARPSAAQATAVTVLFSLLLAGSVVFGGLRPATLAFAWLAGAGLVLAYADLAAHRLPDVVTYPSYAVCAAALLADAAVLGTWDALLRSVAAAAAAFALGALLAALVPAGLGFGDVKLLGLLGLVLGWVGWAVLVSGVFAGLLLGAIGSVALVVARRAGWRTAVPFGPPLLLGSAVMLAVSGSF